MNQIPNIEETKDFPELEKQYVAMWDKGEFEWNHHEGDELGKKPISPWRIWTTFIKPTLHQQLQKARQDERERIRQNFKALCTINNDGDCKYFRDDIHERLLRGDKFVAQEILEALNHSELDQDKK